MKHGRFITVEGGEGTGKSTQVKLLARALRAIGLDVLVTREPGGSVGAERIRPLLVSGDYDWDVSAEYLLFSAARSDHLRKVILPALASGTWVISDRFYDSSYVYQGLVQGLNLEFITQVYETISDGFYPDLTLVFDLDAQEALERSASRSSKENRFEEKGIAFHEAVRAGFLALVEAHPDRMVIIDAKQTKEDVMEAILASVKTHLGQDFPMQLSKETIP